MWTFPQVTSYLQETQIFEPPKAPEFIPQKLNHFDGEIGGRSSGKASKIPIKYQ